MSSEPTINAHVVLAEVRAMGDGINRRLEDVVAAQRDGNTKASKALELIAGHEARLTTLERTGRQDLESVRLTPGGLWKLGGFVATIACLVWAVFSFVTKIAQPDPRQTSAPTHEAR